MEQVSRERALASLSSWGTFHSEMPGNNLAWWIPGSTTKKDKGQHIPKLLLWGKTFWIWAKKKKKHEEPYHDFPPVPPSIKLIFGKILWWYWDTPQCPWCHLQSSLWEEQSSSTQVFNTFYDGTVPDSRLSDLLPICRICSTVVLLTSKSQEVASQLPRADNW